MGSLRRITPSRHSLRSPRPQGHHPHRCPQGGGIRSRNSPGRSSLGNGEARTPVKGTLGSAGRFPGHFPGQKRLRRCYTRCFGRWPGGRMPTGSRSLNSLRSPRGLLAAIASAYSGGSSQHSWRLCTPSPPADNSSLSRARGKTRALVRIREGVAHGATFPSCPCSGAVRSGTPDGNCGWIGTAR